MKKITVIFGGTLDWYLRYFEVFRTIEKKFNCIIRRNGINSLSCKIEDIKFDFLFCLHPIRDENYLSLKKSKEESGWKEIVCLPADELVKKIKNSNMILFFGLCGGFKGKKNDIYFPEKFSEVFFKRQIKKTGISKIKPFNQIKIHNFLTGKLKGKKSKIVTSNLTLMPESIEDKCKASLIRLTNIFLKYGDLVDKEGYQVAKYFNGKVPLGFMFMASDVLTVKKDMMKPKNFNPNKNKFNQTCVKCLKIALNETKQIHN